MFAACMGVIVAQLRIVDTCISIQLPECIYIQWNIIVYSWYNYIANS